MPTTVAIFLVIAMITGVVSLLMMFLYVVSEESLFSKKRLMLEKAINYCLGAMLVSTAIALIFTAIDIAKVLP